MVKYKTGGLGDVGGSLPQALKEQHQDVRIIMPAYRPVLSKFRDLAIIALIHVNENCVVRLLEGKLPGTDITLWLVDSPAHFDRNGGPYSDNNGKDWPDNAERFTVFARTVEHIALGLINLNWQPDIVHCNDWQTGLIPALLNQHKKRPATLFTIHNLAYQGNFSLDTFDHLKCHFQLPGELWTLHGMEFHGLFSFLKGGLMFSDMLNTVSPTYAQEICTKEFGNGMEGLLQHRSDRLRGILNGVDYSQWNPDADPLITHPFNGQNLEGKQLNKKDLQEYFKLPISTEVPLIGMVGRLVEQKGVDLALDVLPKLIENYGLQVVLLGTGQKHFEEAFLHMAARYPANFATNIGFSEKLAHQIEAGSDMFLMPSRYEPCGLNQIYSLRYGAVPIVRYTGGLADTVIQVNEQNLKTNQASGFVFHDPVPEALYSTIETAIHYYRNPQLWRQIVQNGMAADFSWERSALAYTELYQEARKYL
jgi:starch synthase